MGTIVQTNRILFQIKIEAAFVGLILNKQDDQNELMKTLEQIKDCANEYT